jgi:hypothetical protein
MVRHILGIYVVYLTMLSVGQPISSGASAATMG